MTPRPAVDTYVDRLERAIADKETIDPFSHEKGFDTELAYAIQKSCYERRISAGDAALGFKLGLTSRAKQEAMGVADPLWGRLTAGMLLAEDEPLDLGTLIHPRAEPELAFLIGRDVDGPTATTASVLVATDAVFPALEILDSRFKNFKFTLPDVIADNGSAARVVVGGRALDPASCDWQLEGMVLRHNGEVISTAAGAAVSGHPAAAVAWLARRVGRLPAGALILSGGLTAPVVLSAGSNITAEFTNLGSVTLRCT